MKAVRTILLCLSTLLLVAPAFAAEVPLTPGVPAWSACPAASAVPAVALDPLQGAVFATKCASCSDQFRACKTFCNTNNPIFSCQNSNPCAGTCSCPAP